MMHWFPCVLLTISFHPWAQSLQICKMGGDRDHTKNFTISDTCPLDLTSYLYSCCSEIDEDGSHLFVEGLESHSCQNHL